MPSDSASSAARTTSSGVWRNTSGIDAIGWRSPLPGLTTIGQIRSSAVRRFSATSRRDHAVRRLRRRRTVG